MVTFKIDNQVSLYPLNRLSTSLLKQAKDPGGATGSGKGMVDLITVNWGMEMPPRGRVFYTHKPNQAGFLHPETPRLGGFYRGKLATKGISTSGNSPDIN